MKRFKVPGRLIAAVLSVLMVAGLVPIVPITVRAATDSGTSNYVTLPITIRDYASDGMLFECNEMGETGTVGVGAVANITPPNQLFTDVPGGMASYTSQAVDGGIRYTSASTGGYLTWHFDGETRTQVRYAVIKYRTGAGYSSQPTIGHRCSDGNHYMNFNTSGYSKPSTWTTVVMDLGGGSATTNYVTLFPRLNAGAYIEIAYAAFFALEADANAYRAADGQITYTYEKIYNYGNNAGYGLIATNAASHFNDLYVNLANHTEGNKWLTVDTSLLAGTTYIQNGGWNNSYVESYRHTLNNGVVQEVYGALIRSDLVESYLGENGKPVYVQSVVDYLASYMKKTLSAEWQDSATGHYNLWCVMGAKLDDLGGTDLATKIRAQLDANRSNGEWQMGDYHASKAKFEAGKLHEYTQITSCYDAAYFILHNTFADNTGYGQTVEAYGELRMVATTNADGKPCYVFGSAYNDTAYDAVNGVIYNTQTVNADKYNDYALRGNGWNLHRFDPLNDIYMAEAVAAGYTGHTGYGNAASNDTYRDLEDEFHDASDNRFYPETNYHLTLEGHAQFIYHYDDDLYFTFTGDDDVYLYINGVRVLDLGGAHAISKVKLRLNDVIDICGLEEGEAYSFDFFYMERHGTAANFSIETNIRIVDPSMVTTKNAYQNDLAIGYNGYVDAQKPVIYQFGLENKGEAHINDLTFTDRDIHVSLTPDAISLNSETAMSDLKVTFYDAAGNATVDTEVTEDELKAYLAAGLAVGEKMVIYGFRYTIPASMWDGDSFLNRVETTAVAKYENATTKSLTGVADWMVQKYEVLFDPLHVYDWGLLDGEGGFADGTANGVTLTLAELLSVADTATDAYGRPLTDETVADLRLNIQSLRGTNTVSGEEIRATEFTAAGYASGEYVLLLTEVGNTFHLGSYDLSRYTAIEFTYGTDQHAKLGDDGSEFVLTDKDGNVLGRAALSNATDHWKAGSRTVAIPLATAYHGDVYLSMTMSLNAAGTRDGAAVNVIRLVGKSANALNLSPNTTVRLCSASGDYGHVNANAVLNADGSITYKATAPGADVYYYNMVDGATRYGPVRVDVYTYGVTDQIYVIDYDLPVELLGGTHGFLKQNVLTLADNPHATSYAITDTAAHAQYGRFDTAHTDTSVTYTPVGFMNGVDTLNLTLTVQEDGADSVTKFTGIEMTQTVTVAPANVMYYEDNNAGLTYINTNPADANGNVWASFESADKGTEQSADPHRNYGSDPNYATNKMEDMLMTGLALDGLENVDAATLADIRAAVLENMIFGEGVIAPHASNGTLHAMAIRYPNNTKILEFEFTGTGFEIISRTTAAAYAVLTVRVEKRNETTGAYEIYKVIPVISECVGGDLDQIPLVARKDMPYGDYRVTVSTSNIKGVGRMVYIDGVRIYQPLGNDNRYYTADEANATFHEIKTEIKKGNIVYAEIHGDPFAADSANKWVYGATLVENTNVIEVDEETGIRYTASTLTNTDVPREDDLPYNTAYMQVGPNNEIYLGTRTGADLNFIAFYLIKTDDVADEDRSIQIGAHIKFTDEAATGDGQVTLLYGSRSAQVAGRAYAETVSGGTEQYITVDTACLVESEGKCLLMIGTEDGDGEVLALTNLKLNGYEIATNTDDEIMAVAETDMYHYRASTLMRETVNLYNHYMNENLKACTESRKTRGE